MSIKATQPEDSARIKGLIYGARGELYRALAGYQIDEIMDELQTAILALATPSPQPADAKTAALDRMARLDDELGEQP